DRAHNEPKNPRRDDCVEKHDGPRRNEPVEGQDSQRIDEGAHAIVGGTLVEKERTGDGRAGFDVAERVREQQRITVVERRPTQSDRARDNGEGVLDASHGGGFVHWAEDTRMRGLTMPIDAGNGGRANGVLRNILFTSPTRTKHFAAMVSWLWCIRRPMRTHGRKARRYGAT